MVLVGDNVLVIHDFLEENIVKMLNLMERKYVLMEVN
jgi:hypothetical protein